MHSPAKNIVSGAGEIAGNEQIKKPGGGPGLTDGIDNSCKVVNEIITTKPENVNGGNGHKKETEYTYYDAWGKPFETIVRRDLPDGKKEIWHTHIGADGNRVWTAPPADWGPKPLYHLMELSTTDLPILLVEGEKCVEAGQRVTSSFYLTTWPGGSGAWKKTDFEPLTRRIVYLWPDNDESGLKAMKGIAGVLLEQECTVYWLDPPQDKPKGWDIADAIEDGTNIRELIQAARAITAEDFKKEEKQEDKKEKPEVTVLDKDDEKKYVSFLTAPAHGTASDVLELSLIGNTIFERYSNDGNGEFFWLNGCYWESYPTIKTSAREILENAAQCGFQKKLTVETGKDIQELYKLLGKAVFKARTDNFLYNTLRLFSEKVLVFPSIPWNMTPETLPTLTDIIDFSGPEPIAREPKPGEFFRDPVPVKAADILENRATPKFDSFIADLFDEETRKTALHCLSLCIAMKATKVFQVWNNNDGDGGKNTLFDLLRGLLLTRIVGAKGSLILVKGDRSERRFAEIELEHRSGVFFDEVGGTFDISQIKRYTGLSPIRGEAKGKDSKEFMPTWALVAMCNKLPSFFPATDNAFISRLVVLPFHSVFYTDEADRARRLSQGVDAKRLKQGREKDELLNEILEERAGIIASLIRSYIDMRKNYGGRPFLSAECIRAKEKYIKTNDLLDAFFDEYLERDDNGRASYESIKRLWADFSGDIKISTRSLVKLFTDRYSFITTRKMNSACYFEGIKLQKDMEKMEEKNNDLPFSR